jgi:hypothetical protein
LRRQQDNDFYEIKKKIGGLEKVKNSRPEGGVVTELREGGYKHNGKRYKNLKDIPGSGFLVVPEPMTKEEWERESIKQQKKLMEESFEFK